MVPFFYYFHTSAEVPSPVQRRMGGPIRSVREGTDRTDFVKGSHRFTRVSPMPSIKIQNVNILTELNCYYNRRGLGVDGYFTGWRGSLKDQYLC